MITIQDQIVVIFGNIDEGGNWGLNRRLWYKYFDVGTFYSKIVRK